MATALQFIVYLITFKMTSSIQLHQHKYQSKRHKKSHLINIDDNNNDNSIYKYQCDEPSFGSLSTVDVLIGMDVNLDIIIDKTFEIYNKYYPKSDDNDAMESDSDNELKTNYPTNKRIIFGYLCGWYLNETATTYNSFKWPKNVNHDDLDIIIQHMICIMDKNKMTFAFEVNNNTPNPKIFQWPQHKQYCNTSEDKQRSDPNYKLNCYGRQDMKLYIPIIEHLYPSDIRIKSIVDTYDRAKQFMEEINTELIKKDGHNVVIKPISKNLTESIQITFIGKEQIPS